MSAIFLLAKSLYYPFDRFNKTNKQTRIDFNTKFVLLNKI